MSESDKPNIFEVEKSTQANEYFQHQQPTVSIIQQSQEPEHKNGLDWSYLKTASFVFRIIILV